VLIENLESKSRIYGHVPLGRVFLIRALLRYSEMTVDR